MKSVFITEAEVFEGVSFGPESKDFRIKKPISLKENIDKGDKVLTSVKVNGFTSKEAADFLRSKIGRGSIYPAYDRDSNKTFSVLFYLRPTSFYNRSGKLDGDGMKDFKSIVEAVNDYLG